MAKAVLNDLVNLENQTSAVNTINANNAVIETAFDNTLSRDGTPPNKMSADLDMNSNRILNLPFPGSPHEPVRLEDFDLAGIIKGMNPANIPAFPSNNVKTYGASGSGVVTTASIVGNTLTFSSPPDFLNGQGILVYGAGAASTVGVPSITYLNALGATGSTTYSYRVATIDNTGAMSAAGLPSSISTGYVTLGTYMPDSQGIARNELRWTLGSGPVLATVVWRSKNGSPYQLVGCFRGTSLNDCGGTQTIRGIPSGPPSVPTPSWLYGVVSSGQGTSVLTLSVSASTSVGGTTVIHDDTNAINLALATETLVYFPQGTYYVRGMYIPSTVVSIKGEAGGLSVINTLTEVLGGCGVATQGSTHLYMYGMKIVQENPIVIGGFYLEGRTGSKIVLNDFSGYRALRITNGVNTTILNNSFSNWYDIAIWDTGLSNSVISGNTINPIGAQFGAIMISATPVGSEYQYATGIWCDSVDCLISNNWIELKGGSFGISSSQFGGLITGNTVKYTGREAIICNGSFSKVSGNLCYWKPNGNGNLSSYDFGFSMADSPNAVLWVEISNNTFISTAASGIAIYGAGTTNITYINITNNTLFNTNQLFYGRNGIEISGGNVSAVHVGGNSFINPGTGALYFVAEIDNGFGVPSFNAIGIQNYSDAGTSGTVHLIGTGSGYITRPAVVAGGGY